ncbi:unnamed protein product [Amaranthus hypochondriacus]
MKKSGLQWSFANNSAAAYSQFLSFKSSQEQGGTHKQYPPGFSQRSLSLEKQGGGQHVSHAHPWQTNDAYTTAQAKKMVPSAIQTSILSPHLTPNSPNVISSPITPVFPVPTQIGPVVGSTDLKSSPSISVGPCQLTLFYNGSVCVYDNVSPEKAQAIMLLAGNGESKNPTASPAPALQSRPTPPKDIAVTNLSVGLSSSGSLPLPAPVSPLSAVATSIPIKSEGFTSSVSLSSLSAVASSSPIPSGGFSSSISLPKPVSFLPGVASDSAIEASPIKSVVTPHVKCPETPKSDPLIGASAAKSVPSAVPQARKASLARFLEKRKERVTAASPYVISKNASECSDGSTFLANSASSSPLPASN